MYLRNLFFQTEKLDEHFRFGGHAHAGRQEMLLGLSGVLGIQLGKKIIYLSKGDLFFIPDGVFHHFWSAKNPSSYYNISFETDLPACTRLVKSGRIHCPERRFTEMLSQEKKRTPEEVMALLLEIFLDLEKKEGVEMAVPVKTGITHPTFVSGVANALTGLIEKDPAKNYTLDDLGKFFGLGKNYLITRIKKTTGYTAMDLYYRIKIDLAKTFLREGRSSAEVSERLGFSNPYHFSRKFKQVAGVLPSKYAKH